MKKRMDQLILNDVFPNWLTGEGIIATLTEHHPVPWKESIPDGSVLDLEYYGNHSGNKIVAPIMYRLINVQSGGITDENRAKLAALIWARYGLSWTKRWDTLSFDYNPISNYDMTETEGITGSGSNGNTRTLANQTEHRLNSSNTKTLNTTTTDKHTGDNTVDYDGTDITGHSGDDTVTTTGSTKNENKTYGFNSDTAVPSDESTMTYQGNDGVKNKTAFNSTETLTHDTTTVETHNTTDTNTQSGTITDVGSGSDTDINSGTITDNGTSSSNSSRTLTRSGNIGVTTSQQMIQSERELWDWEFFETVYKDIDEMITIQSYGDGCPDWVDIVKESGSVYVLPVATATRLGGVKPATKTSAMVNPVGVDASGRLWSEGGGTSAGVSSVNGKSGVVILSATDVGAVPAGTLAVVASTGNYNDLTNKPTLFSGNYNDLSNKPTLFSGNYNDLSDKPDFAAVATSGSYNDLSDKPYIPEGATVDSELSTTSQNAVQNKVLTELLGLENISEIGTSITNAINTLNVTKISESDVVDNLTTTITDVPLSANQGKVLNEKIDSTLKYHKDDVLPDNTWLFGFGFASADMKTIWFKIPLSLGSDVSNISGTRINDLLLCHGTSSITTATISSANIDKNQNSIYLVLTVATALTSRTVTGQIKLSGTFS